MPAGGGGLSSHEQTKEYDVGIGILGRVDDAVLPAGGAGDSSAAKDLCRDSKPVHLYERHDRHPVAWLLRYGQPRWRATAVRILTGFLHAVSGPIRSGRVGLRGL